MKKIITGISLALLVSSVQANGIGEDKALADELAYLHAEYIYSANKKLQNVNDVAAAVFVVSQEDIRRSGATSVPEALRMVPGLQVTQIDANKWAISARGFNDRFSTKLLVMIDGRAIYTPVFAGVYWNREDTLLEDVERIEVVRGAGAAIWGANAVNGVINIITKSAKDSHGILLNAGTGNQEQAFVNGRYGDKIGENFDYRLYAKGFQRNHNTTLTGQNGLDNWGNYQGGFKTEWKLNSADTVTTQGDIYHSHGGGISDFALTSPPFLLANQYASGSNSGGNIQTQWKHKISETSETALQLYYKHDDSVYNLITPYRQHEKTIDVSFQHRFNLLKQHDIIWGAGYRYFHFSSNQSAKMRFNPPHLNLQLFSLFLQDEISLLQDRVKLTLGARLERNDFTGFEVQPNIRLLWTPDDKQTVWGSISRAVRTPALVDRNLQNFTNPVENLGLGLPAVSVSQGNTDFKSETVLDYELGYRIRPTTQLSFDLTAFYNQYNRLQVVELSNPFVAMASNTPYFVIPSQFTNNMKGETMGFELATQWQPVDWFKMQASYALLKTNLQTPPGFYFVGGVEKEKNVPQQQVNVKASVNLPFDVELDGMLRYVDAVPYYTIPSYVAVDMRLGWKPHKNLELSIVGQNLFDKQHPEFVDGAFQVPQIQIRRSVFGKIGISF